jgi:hypothetical protein
MAVAAIRRSPGATAGKQNDARDRKIPATVAKADKQSGVMVALYPKGPKKLAVEGGEKVKDLHLTLAFLGDAAALQSPDQLRAVVAGFAAACPPLQGEISGPGHFKKPGCTVALVDMPHLPKKRERLRSSLVNAGQPVSDDHGFVPHITLAYDKVKAKHVAGKTVKFDKVSLVIGGKRQDFQLQGDPAAISKADDDPEAEPASPAEVLGRRAALLSAQLEAEVATALSELGETASTAYLTVAQKADKPSRRQTQALTRRVLLNLGVKNWSDDRLGPILRNHAARVAVDTQRTLRQETGLPLALDEAAVQRMVAKGGGQLKVSDIEPQVRMSIEAAITQGAERGDNPTLTARRIRDAVPDGRFVHAGGRYRSQLIARNETASLQREASLGLYESNDHIKRLRIRDGIYGPPRSDQTCMDRDGEIIPIEQARSTHPYHPLCTLGFEPVIG